MDYVYSLCWWDCWEGGMKSLHRTMEGAMAELRRVEEKENKFTEEHIADLVKDIESEEEEDYKESMKHTLDNLRASINLKEQELTDFEKENGYLKKFQFNMSKGYWIKKEKINE